MNIYAGQLPYNVKEDELRKIFSKFGEIASIKLIVDRYSGRSKGYAFIEMPDNSEADKAIKALNRSVLDGKEIKVNQVQPQRKGKKTRRGR